MRIVLLFFISLIGLNVFSQRVDDKHKSIKKSYIIGLLPSESSDIYGLALGLIGSEVKCDKFYTKKSHGVNLQLLGHGFFTPFYVFNPMLNWTNYQADSVFYDDSLHVKRVVHNGLLVSVFGTFSEEVNGISVSPWMSMNHKVNGLNLNLLINSVHSLNGASIGLYNSTYSTKGIQIGLVNQTNRLKGVQIGLWNINQKRTLPFLNLCF